MCERCPAAGSWNNTRPTGEPLRSDFCSSAGFSDRAGLPCPCHLSCYRTSVKRQRRCPCAGRGWFTNISGEYNYTASPGRAALCGFRMEREGGRREQQGWGAEWTLKTAFSFPQPYFNVCFQDQERATSPSAPCFINPTLSLSGSSCSQRLRRLTCYLRDYMLWLWYKQTAHLPHSPRY